MAARIGKLDWIGRVISALVVALFAMSAVMKFVGGEEVIRGMEHLGLPGSRILPLGIPELACVLIYAFPATSVLGTVLLSAALGPAGSTLPPRPAALYTGAGVEAPIPRSRNTEE